MRWGFPLSFLFLLGVIPLIIFLHSLRPRGSKVKTTVLFVLERILRERPMGKRLGFILRNNLLLILQILTAVLLIAVLADPRLLHFAASESQSIVVVDLSASMKAKGTQGVRFDQSRRDLLALVDGMGSRDKMMVIGAGTSPQVLMPFTADRQALKRLARNLEPADAPARVQEAVLFAYSFLREGSPGQIVLLSDGAFAGAQDLPWQSSHFRWIRAKGGKENVGIVGFQFRRLPGEVDRHEILVSLRSYLPGKVSVPLQIRVGEKTLVEETVDLEPGERRVRIYPYRGFTGGRAVAFLGIEDDFPTDNFAYLTLSEYPVLRVLYVGKGNPFLERLFRSFPSLEVEHRDTLDAAALPAAMDGSELIVFDGVPPPPLSAGNYILINTVGGNLPVKSEGRIQRPRPLPLLRNHPLVQSLQLEDVYIEDSLRFVATGHESVMLRSEESPLIFTLEQGRLKVLMIGFDLLSSDLPYRVAFPVLFGNALRWFHLERREFPGVQVPAGSPIHLSLPASERQVEVATPAGAKRVVPVDSNPFVFTDTRDTGFYLLRTGSANYGFGVSLLSESESQILPGTTNPEPTLDKRDRSAKLDVGLALWPGLLLLVIAFFLLEALWAYRRGENFLPVIFRLAAVSAVVLALANPKIFRAVRSLDVVLAVDYSHSVVQAGKEMALEILERGRKLTDASVRAGLLFFGKQSLWEFLPQSEYRVADYAPALDRGGTDIQSALQAVLAQKERGRQARILLVSDGNENRGKALQAAGLLRSLGVSVWVLPVNLSRGNNEVYLREFSLPQQVASEETFEIKAAVESLSEVPARLRLVRDGVIESERDVQLHAGTNWFRFARRLQERGSHVFELLVESPEDTLSENNLLQGLVEVKGPPRVLYLHSAGEHPGAFSGALSVQGYDVVHTLPEQSPVSLPALSGYDLLVLDNVPAHDLSQAKLEVMENYVRDLGGGLVVIGGPKSYGAGGYFQTPLERVLPVEMRPPARLDLPHVALLFILDKSGSMGGDVRGSTKLDLAKAAAMAAADLLNASDEVGILAFDAEWEWVLPFRRVEKGEWISDRLSSLQSDGGTDLYKAMVEAHRALAANPAAVKHMLVLSDGLTDQADFSALVERMAEEKITVSTVAVGRDADAGLMSSIAREGKGRGYISTDPSNIPRIFTMETLLIARELLVEKTVVPRVEHAGGPLQGFSGKSLPPLRGYVLTRPKPGSDLHMRVEEDPLLVSWRYGLGRVVAFTSDLTGRWGREWARWEEFPRWAGQLARSALKKTSEEKIRASFIEEGDGVKAVIDIFGEGGFLNHLQIRGNLASLRSAAEQKDLIQVAPGRYEAFFSGLSSGAHFLTLSQEGNGDGPPSVATTVSFVSSYPSEFKKVTPNMALLGRIAEESGGAVVEPERMGEWIRRLFTPDEDGGYESQDTWWPLSGLGMLLFLGDLALRRLPRRSP